MIFITIIFEVNVDFFKLRKLVILTKEMGEFFVVESVKLINFCIRFIFENLSF